MATISVSLPSDGSTADVADYNTPITTITNEINGNLDNANIKASAAIDGSKIADSGITTAKIADANVTNAKLATTTNEPGGAWESYTPTWTNLTVGNGTVDAKYKKVGRTVSVRLSFTLGSTSAVGSGPIFTLPVASAALGATLTHFLGHAYLHGNIGIIRWVSTTTADFTVMNTTGTYEVQNGITATVPVTWANGHVITLNFQYESAT